MATSRRFISIFLAFGAIACAADPTLLNLVMPDAKVFFGVNVEKIVASPIGQQIRSQIRQAPPELQQIFTDTGFAGALRALEQSWGRDPATMVPDIRFTPNPADAPVERGE